MLLILLTILKIIGIIIASILGLIILVAMLLLIDPVRYRAKVNYDTDPDIEIKFSYIFHMIRGVFTYNKDGSDVSIKVVWFKLGNKTKSSGKKPKVKKSKKSKKTEDSYTDTLSSVPVKSPGLQVAETDKGPEQKSDTNTNTDTDNSSGSSSSHKNRFSGMSGKLSGIKGSLSGLIANITDEDNKESFLYVLMNIRKIIKHIHPQKHKICIYFGTSDPAMTGQITGALAVAATVLNLNMYVYPDFEKTMLKVNSWYKGRVRIITLGIVFLRMYRNKKLRATIKKFMK